MATKLGALVRDHFGVSDANRSGFGGGAALLDGDRAWVLVDDRPARGLGAALAWAHQHGVGELHLLVEDSAGVLARRATAFAQPPRVWWVQGRELHAVDPEPPTPTTEPPIAALELAPLLSEGGADVVVEHGVVTGEVLGLEVAIVVLTDDGARVEVGVGRHDREAFAILHGDVPPADAIGSVVSTVRRYRRAGAPDHPLYRLAPERWLRHVLLHRPPLVEAVSLEAVESTVPRRSVKDMTPAIATGTGRDGVPVVVACSVGIDLDLVPAAADARLAVAPTARLVLAVPERDDHPITRALAAELRQPATLVAVPGDWRSIA